MKGPRGRWLTIAVWLAIAAAGFVLRGHIDQVTAAGQASFLPKDSEFTRALKALERVGFTNSIVRACALKDVLS